MDCTHTVKFHCRFVQILKQQYLFISETYDWWRCGRYGLYGSCYVAPTLYTWLTVASIMWPGNTIRAGMIKVKLLFKLLYFFQYCLKITDFPKTAKSNPNPESKINLMKVIPLYNFHQVYLTLCGL